MTFLLTHFLGALFLGSFRSGISLKMYQRMVAPAALLAQGRFETVTRYMARFQTILAQRSLLDDVPSFLL